MSVRNQLRIEISSDIILFSIYDVFSISNPQTLACPRQAMIRKRFARYTNLSCSESLYKTSYTPAVDIWSLDVAVFEHTCSLPYPSKYQGIDLCKETVKEVNNWENEDFVSILIDYYDNHRSKISKSSLRLLRSSTTVRSRISRTVFIPNTCML